MSMHSIAEAQANLFDLVDRAQKGEEVVITRDGLPVVRLNGMPKEPGRRITAEDVAWLDRNRVGTVLPEEDAGAFVSRMRDEDWAK